MWFVEFTFFDVLLNDFIMYFFSASLMDWCSAGLLAPIKDQTRTHISVTAPLT